MPLTIHENRAFFGIDVPLEHFARLAQAHLTAFPNTPRVEAQGHSFVEGKFPKAQVRKFVRVVCEWGGYPGISGRVLNRNTSSVICSALKLAVECLDRQPPDLAAALGRVNRLKGLGAPSFASKHLRFMRPDLCPVFDSLLQKALPYSFDAEGYAVFAQDCHRLADTLTRTGLQNPRERPAHVWFVADVEAALYAYVKGLDVAPA